VSRRAGLSPDERIRYARHLALPGVGEDGQERLKAARVLIVGAGGLGAPVALYLAAAGSVRSASSISTRSTSRTSSARSSTPPVT